MELTDRILICTNKNDLPDFNTIQSLPRGIQLKILFNDPISSKREKIGKQWRIEHTEFQIGIHRIEPEINMVKLITDSEIIDNQLFFEQCAKDYKNLATLLITEFAHKHNVKINPDSPMDTLCHSRRNGYEPVGEMGDWRYAFHGIHCAFRNLKTGQGIEVPLTFGLEFGQLDPYFFTRFIKSTKEYEPLPVGIYCDYADGDRILNKMVELGRFEIINSNWPNHHGIVVTDREKVEVKEYVSEHPIIPEKHDTSIWTKLKRWWS